MTMTEFWAAASNFQAPKPREPLNEDPQAVKLRRVELGKQADEWIRGLASSDEQADDHDGESDQQQAG